MIDSITHCDVCGTICRSDFQRDGLCRDCCSIKNAKTIKELQMAINSAESIMTMWEHHNMLSLWQEEEKQLEYAQNRMAELRGGDSGNAEARFEPVGEG